MPQRGGGGLTAMAKHLWAVLALGPVMRELVTVWIAGGPLVRALLVSAASRSLLRERVVHGMERIEFASDVMILYVCLLSRATAYPSFCCRPQAGLGTWRHAAVLSSSHVLAVPKSVPLAVAATLTSGASTALRLLSDFSSLSSGDVVVQSGGESAVGEAVVQLAAKRGVKTITFVKVRTGAVLLVGVVSHMETLRSRRSIRADTCGWMIFLREMRGRRLFGARPRYATRTGAWRRTFPPSASTRDLHH